MKNIKKILFIIIILLTSITGKVYADDVTPPVIVTPDPISIHLTITTNSGHLYDQDINVNACNSDNASTTDLKVTAYCAVLQSGIQSDWNWSWAPGAFLNSLGNISGYTSKDKDDKDVYHYWSWSLNNIEGLTGLNQYELQPNDLISITFVDPLPPMPDPVIVTPTPTPDPEPVHASHGGGAIIIAQNQPKIEAPKKVFDIDKAFDFIISQQKENGSFGEDLYTDWVALALGTTEKYTDQKIKLIKYLSEEKIKDYQLTDYERRSMALMALNLNPYNTNNVNYIKKITDSFNVKQFGDANEDNDDIFALIVLQNAGYVKDDQMIKETINFILSKQKDDGSWDGNVDMTGAAIEALSTFSPTPGVGESLNKAKDYLKQSQKDNGGWDNVSSTSWAIEGILSLSEKPEDWTKNNFNPFDYLATNQDTDGIIKNEDSNNKIWQTAYALNALSGKTWNQIMRKFEKPKEEVITQKSEEKITKKVITKNTTKKIESLAKISNTEKTMNEVKNLTNQNTATVINSLDTNKEKSNKSWFKNLLNKIFSIF